MYFTKNLETVQRDSTREFVTFAELQESHYITLKLCQTPHESVAK